MQGSHAPETIPLRRRFQSMTHITHQRAATHDHWFDEPAGLHAVPALRLWWRHFAKHHPMLVDAIEWTGSGVLALGLLFGTLIANA